jgi:hypothetical protein
MKKIYYFIILGFLVNNFSFAQADSFFSKADDFLKKNVIGNKVNYEVIKKNPEELNELVTLISDYKISKNDDTDKAFLINAYNLLVIKGIVNKYPTKSPLDIAGFFDKSTYSISGKKVTLNDIENKLLRAVYKDARLHFVLVCGANGCPPLLAEAYMPKTIETQLEQQTTKALNNPNFIKVIGNKIQLSQIFEWYKEDFKNKEIEFINKYRKDKLDAKSKFSYYTYDWSLNKK